MRIGCGDSLRYWKSCVDGDCAIGNDSLYSGNLGAALWVRMDKVKYKTITRECKNRRSI